jgi:hypothetical protein
VDYFLVRLCWISNSTNKIKKKTRGNRKEKGGKQRNKAKDPKYSGLEFISDMGSSAAPINPWEPKKPSLGLTLYLEIFPLYFYISYKEQ